MRLRLQAVRLRALTRDGAWGGTVTFGPGFNVVRGGNSRGKTQVVQAIIYALGLERMLQARANTPLGSALTSELRTGEADDSPTLAVVSSWVAVQFEDETGQVVTAQRHVKHHRLAHDLVRVWSGPALTDPAYAATTQPVEMFVHQPGSASRELGFHRLLAEKLGWDLPQVAKFDGTTTMLYVDVLFPFLIVDQQSWGSGAPRKVGRYQIREPLRRSAEFLLGLAGPQAEAQRGDLEQKLTALRTRWAAARAALNTAAGAIGGRVVGVPEHAAGAQARSSAPEPTRLGDAELQVLQNDEWMPVSNLLETLSTQLREAEMIGQRPIAQGVDEHAQRELHEARSQLADVVAAARLVENDLSFEEAQLAAIDRRVATLQEERHRNQDIRTLVRLGSEAAATHLAEHNCPTCRQSLDAVEASDFGPVLDVDETVSLLNAQINTANKMRGRSQQVVTQAANAYAAMQRQADQIRATIKALESDLLAPAEAPRAGEIARRVTLELRLDELQRAQSVVNDQLDELAGIAEQIAAVRAQLSALPTGVPDADTQRLSEVTVSMRQRLTATRFDSYNVRDVSLDQDSLQPARSGFDLDSDVSASDVVRIKVAYLDAVRVLGQALGRHPGLLVLDEPRQQDIDPVDYAAMLRYLAASNDDGGQVIVTSATPRHELDQILSSVTARMIDLGDKRLLQRVVNADALDTN